MHSGGSRTWQAIDTKWKCQNSKSPAGDSVSVRIRPWAPLFSRISVARGCPDLAQERMTPTCDSHIILWTVAFAQCRFCLCGQISQASLELPDNRPQTCSAGDINGFIAFFVFNSDPSSLEGAPRRLDRNRWSLPVASLSPCVPGTSGSSRARTSSEPTNRASFSQPCRLEG
jgi:hypothetical protein